jgi:hypothetical protein
MPYRRLLPKNIPSLGKTPIHTVDPEKNRNPINRRAVAVLLTVALSLIYLRISQFGGRLAQDLTYDDIGYAKDAADRLILLSRHGFFAFAQGFVQNPPHSPFSTLLALGAFAVGGMDDLVLYAANILPLTLVSLLITSELRDARTGIWLIALGIVLFSPIAYRTIHDFRPDIVLGFGTAMMAWWFFGGWVAGEPGLFRKAGYALGACLLIKPSFFAHTLAIALFIAGLAVCEGIARRYARTRMAVPAKGNVAAFLGLGFLIAAPYYLVNGNHALQYFWDNTRGSQAEIWSFAANIPFGKLLYTYLLDREGNFPLLGYHLFYAMVLLPMGIGFLFRRGAKPEAVRILGVCAAALASLCIIVVGRHRNHFFLASFQWMVLLSAVFAIATVDARLGGRQARLFFRSIILAGLCLSLWMNGTLVHWRSPPDALRATSWNRKIVDMIRQSEESNVASRKAIRNPRVFFSFAGPVNAETVNWLGLREGFAIDAFDSHRSGDLAQARSSAENSDYVVLPSPSTSTYHNWLPSAAIQGPLLEWVAGDARFKPLTPLSPSSRYLVFVNVPRLEADSATVIRSDGIASVQGFLQKDEPYPRESLPRVRWMSAESARICLFPAISPQYEVILRFRADKPGRFEVFDEAHNPLAGIELMPGSFQELAFRTFPVQGKNCLNFSVKLDSIADPGRLLLFSRIEVKGKS